MIEFQNLPFEIKQKVLENVEKGNLLQCLLTCQQWHEISKHLLYSEITIDKHGESATKFTRTMTENPLIGELVKSINLVDLNSKEKYFKKPWNNLEVLSQLIKTCPNITRFECEDSVSQECWDTLLDAGKTGKWKEVELLPNGETGKVDVEFYLRVASQFKHSLKKIYFFHYGRTNLAQPRNPFFYENSKQLKDFTNLEELIISHRGSHRFLDIDPIIQNCVSNKLKSINATFLPFGLEDWQTEFTSREINASCRSVIPRKDIKNLSITRVSFTDNALSFHYLMKKFPSLDQIQLLECCETTGTYNIPSQAFVEFLDFCTKIAKHDVTFPLGKMDDIWINYLKDHNLLDTLILKSSYSAYFGDDEEQEVQSDGDELYVSTVTYSNEQPLTVSCIATNLSQRMPFFRPLEKLGFMVENLTIKGVYNIQASFEKEGFAEIPTHDLYGNWFYQVLNYCSSLKHLVIDQPRSFILLKEDFRDYRRHDSLESLFINGPKSRITEETWSALSDVLPGLKNLHLSSSAEFEKTVKIVMKDTCFETLFISNDSLSFNVLNGSIIEDWVMYLKLKTVAGEQYYVSSNSNLESCSQEQYEIALNNSLYFTMELVCKSINNLRIKYKKYFNYKTQHLKFSQ